MASCDSKGEIVPIELPNPEETQIRKGENELVRSRLTLTFADKHRGCYGNGLINVAISTQSSSAHVEEKDQELWGTLEQDCL